LAQTRIVDPHMQLKSDIVFSTQRVKWVQARKALSL
jgi:hypothetical protein